MRCPKCGNEIENEFCKECNKSAIDIYYEKAEEAEAEKDFDGALKYLYELRKINTSTEVGEDIERKIKGIRFEIEENMANFEADKKEGEAKGTKIKTDEVYTGMKVLFIGAIALFAGIALFQALYSFYYTSKNIPTTQINNRKLNVAFLFHMNQPIESFGDIADKTSYNGLLKVLRNHKNLKFNIHISGTAIQDLKWYNPETLRLIKEGIDDGQFELLGSTYSQNVMYSTDDVSNQWQIDRHREIIKDTFGVEPVGFWNAERTWRQSLEPLITNNGYKYTFIENHISRKSGSKKPQYIVRSTGNGKLICVNDDVELIPMFDDALDKGQNEYKVEKRGPNLTDKSMEYKKLLSYIRGVYEKDKDEKYLLSYAQDAEATGSWDFMKQKNPEWNFKNLDFLLGKLEEMTWLRTVKYSDVVRKENISEDITPIKDGAADWMEKAASDPGVNFGEGDYKNWFEYNEKSPKLAYYREIHKKTMGLIKKYEGRTEENIKSLIKLQREAFLSFQYEFGCTGIGGTKKDWDFGEKRRVWEGMKHIAVITDVIENIIDYKEKIYEKDINNDGIDEVVVIKNYNYYVLSKARGARLLYWYDMTRGIEISGGEMGLQFAEKYYDDNFATDIIGFGDETRFFVGNDELTNYLSTKEYLVRTKALNEKIYATGEENTDMFKMPTTYKATGTDYIAFEIGKYKKNIKFTDTGMEVEYIMPENVDEIEVSSEFQPDYYTILDKGKEIVESKFEGNKATIYNTLSKVGVEIEYPKGSAHIFKDPLHGVMSVGSIKGTTGKIIIKKI